MISSQRLERQFSGIETFGLVLTNSSVIIGIIPFFGIAMFLGGPVSFTWGWLITGLFTCCIGLSLAEICSTFPALGGLYYYSAALGGEYGPIASWFTCWFNALGQIAGCSGSVFAGAQFLNIYLSTVGLQDYLIRNNQLDPVFILLTFGIMIVLIGFINSWGGTALRISSYLSTFIHIIGTFVIILTILVSTPTKQPSSFVFTHFKDTTGWTALGAPPIFVIILGLLPSAWTLIGYDSSAHLSEETVDAQINGPSAIMWTLGWNIILGWGLILSLTFCITDYTQGGIMAAQIFIDGGNSLLLLIVSFAGFLCGVGTVTANSRLLLAFAQNGGLPYSNYLANIDIKSSMPVRLVWLSCISAFLLCLPVLFSSVVLSVIGGISIIGFTVSYAIPILLKITVAKTKFKQSDFHLGGYSDIIGWISVFWTLFLLAIFQFPNNTGGSFPITIENFNFVPVIIIGLGLLVGGWWMIDARYWFKGPHVYEIADSD